MVPRGPREWDPSTGDGTLVEDPATRAPLVLGGRDFHSVTETVCGYIERGMGGWWFPAFGLFSTVAGLMPLMILYLIITGVGVWGLNNQVDWAWDITNFVFWIGIGHAGTLISAILCLFKQKWADEHQSSGRGDDDFRGHLCRDVPGDSRRARVDGVDAFPRSPTPMRSGRTSVRHSCGDVYAVSTYGTVSLLFWYMGMIPDFATLRDRACLRLMKDPEGDELPFVGWRVDKVRAVV